VCNEESWIAKEKDASTMCVRECVGEREQQQRARQRESECVCVCERAYMTERLGGWVGVCVCECVCVCVYACEYVVS